MKLLDLFISNAVSQNKNAGFLKEKQLSGKSRKGDDLGLGGSYTGAA